MTEKPVLDARNAQMSAQFSRSDRLDVPRMDGARSIFTDAYHTLVRIKWRHFLTAFGCLFIGLNIIFALLYLCDPNGLAGGEDLTAAQGFWRAFFFSVDTIATVGYGNVVPKSFFANVVVTGEIGVGILLIALTSGLMFARFSIPSARIMFSEPMVVQDFEGVPTLMFRAANQRNNFILEASVRVSLIRQEVVGSQTMRRFQDLALKRATNPVFALSWVVMHPIDEKSPLYGWSPDDLVENGDEIVVVLTGLDASLGQNIHARHGYGATAIKWGHRFADIMGFDDNGRRIVHYQDFHVTEPIAGV